jgi:hypothetical protein
VHKSNSEISSGLACKRYVRGTLRVKRYGIHGYFGHMWIPSILVVIVVMAALRENQFGYIRIMFSLSCASPLALYNYSSAVAFSSAYLHLSFLPMLHSYVCCTDPYVLCPYRRDDWSDCYVVVHSDSGPRRSVQISGEERMEEREREKGD